jgi:hypothetical protein
VPFLIPPLEAFHDVGLECSRAATVRCAFAGFRIETVDIKYTVGGGGREAARQEVVIFSWDER